MTLTAVSPADEDEAVEEREGWETISMDGKQIGIKTSAIEEKCQAFETMVIYCSTLGSRFAPYLSQSLELGEQSSNTRDIFGSDAVNIAVKRPGVGEWWSGGEELEEVGRQQVCARHVGYCGGVKRLEKGI